MKKQPSNIAPTALFRASQRRVGELSQALQDVYTWAYTSGELSELDSIITDARVPIPREMVTRSEMVRVWEEEWERLKKWRTSGLDTSVEMCLAQMMYYSSLMVTADLIAKETAREWLWKVAYYASLLMAENFDALTLALEEYFRAAEKHPGMTLECDGHTDASRLFALVEEIGEVAACLTYDNDAETGHGSDLESEVIQVIALALAWATRYIDDEENWDDCLAR